MIELLVVVAIVLAVSALSVAVVVPSLEQRQIRNASLSVTSFINGVRAEAIRTGRPTGVWIERADGPLGDRYATRMYRCTIPPAYSGISLTETLVAVVDDTTDPPRQYNVVRSSMGPWPEPLSDGSKDPTSPVGPGDAIKLGHQGHTYRLQWASAINEWIIGEWDGVSPTWTMNSDTAIQPFVTPTTGIPYQVHRLPRLTTFARSAAQPLVLPPGTVIDLNFSGDEVHNFHLKDESTNPASMDDHYVGPSLMVPLTVPVADRDRDYNPIILMFGKTGAVERIYHTEEDSGLLSEGERPTGPIYLLLGRQDKAQSLMDVASLQEVALDGASSEREMRAEQVERYNLFDLNNLWITIHPRSGAVTSSPVAAPDATAINPEARDLLRDPENEISPLGARVEQARGFARSSQGLGGG